MGAPGGLGSGTVLLLILAVTLVLKLLNLYWVELIKNAVIDSGA